MSRRIALAAFGSLSAGLAVASPAWAGPVVVEDFEDGPSGFVVAAPGFELNHGTEGGNPAGHVRLTDLLRNGPGGFADAPAAFRGDLSTYRSVQWDVLRPEGALAPSTVILAGAGNEFTYDGDANGTGAWLTNAAPLNDAGAWTRTLGDGTFADTLGDVTRLGFLLEVTDGTGLEAALDNVRLVPGASGTVIPLPAALPATLAAFGPFVAGAALRRWRRRQ